MDLLVINTFAAIVAVCGRTKMAGMAVFAEGAVAGAGCKYADVVRGAPCDPVLLIGNPFAPALATVPIRVMVAARERAVKVLEIGFMAWSFLGCLWWYQGWAWRGCGSIKLPVTACDDALQKRERHRESTVRSDFRRTRAITNLLKFMAGYFDRGLPGRCLRVDHAHGALCFEIFRTAARLDLC